jgi:hypothetical protein
MKQQHQEREVTIGLGEGRTGFVRWIAEGKWWRKAVFSMIELLWQG